ncbi:MAG: hypothetical protein ACE5JO_14535, partial [Candidatus Binatia bacterium]
FMKDTAPKLESCFFEMIMEKSGQERLKMGFSMFEFARHQILSSIVKENPKASTKDIRAQLFSRLYGEDFSTEEQKWILAKLQ